jgi:quercetin dioxygenase-like cupin family protein
LDGALGVAWDILKRAAQRMSTLAERGALADEASYDNEPITDTRAGDMEESDLLGDATALTALVEYQDGTVVSRTLVKKKTGTVTLFAFDEGEGLSEHTTPFDALVLVADGSVEITVSGQTMLVKEGEALLLPADEPHALKAVTRFKMLLIMIRS